ALAPDPTATRPAASLEPDPGAARPAASDPDPGATDVLHAELELKFDVADRAALRPLLDSPEIAGLSGGEWRETFVEDRYVDTRDGLVGRHGYAARLRERGDRTILGLKSLTPARGALHRREELEAPAAGGLDPAAWPPSEARSLLLEASAGEPLEELFVVRQHRRVRVIQGPGGTVELSADEVEVIRDGKPLAMFPVLEAELRDGDEAILGRLSRAIRKTGAVRPSSRSKFEAAAALAAAADAAGSAGEQPGEAGDADSANAAPSPATPAGQPGQPARRAEPAQPAEAAQPGPLAPPAPPALIVGKSPGVSAEDTFAEAGRKVIRFHLARMLATEEGARSGEHVEDLHKMRVATRRMRAAWRVFGDGFRARRVRRSVGSLRALAAHLGAVRDLDVLMDGLEAHGATQDAAARMALSPLEDAWRSERATARAALLRYLDSTGYLRFVEEQLTFVESPGQDAVVGGPTDPRRVRETAPSRLWAAYETVRAYDGVLRWADLTTLHQLRIAGKRLRYAIEFVREPMGPDAVTLVERVTALQDQLGMLHDADVAAGLARAFLVEHAATLPPASASAIGGYLAAKERDMTRLRRAIGPAWRRVTSIEFRRALGRAVAIL
ncbi:MAG TPA: CHAD domain-containing protein, partial [Candidatus Acidoferrales bacterium]|nr:CHAD domain-containing protein [Candidatus Acidoferrales bacterium]